jgi:hypothetical protein
LGTHTLLTQWFGTNKLAQVVSMLGAITVGVGFYGGMMATFARKELMEMINEFRHRRNVSY